MISSSLKLLSLGAAMVGPFIAGAVRQYVVDPEAYVFFALCGVMVGVSGLFGFCAIERGEIIAHERHLRGER